MPGARRVVGRCFAARFANRREWACGVLGITTPGGLTSQSVVMCDGEQSARRAMIAPHDEEALWYAGRVKRSGGGFDPIDALQAARQQAAACGAGTAVLDQVVPFQG